MEIELKKGEKIILELFCSHMKGIEAVGGKVVLTNKRFIFKSHKFNLQNHKLEINVSNIKLVRVGKLYKLLPGRGMVIELKDGSEGVFSPRNRTQLIKEIDKLIK